MAKPYTGRASGALVRSLPGVPVAADDVVELVSDRLGYRGEGVARVDGFTVFVPGALPGERVRGRIGRLHRTFAEAELLVVDEPSVDRVDPACPVFARCGGCQLQHMGYGRQLAWKRSAVVEALARIGRFDAAAAESLTRATVGMEDPWRYRNKVSVAATAHNGRFVAGFMEEGTHEPVTSEVCLIRPETHDELLERLLDGMTVLGIKPARETRGRGDTVHGHVRQIVVRTTTAGDAMIVAESVQRIPHADELARRLAGRMPDGLRLASFVERCADGTERLIWGAPHLEESLLGLRLRVSPGSFLQVNPRQTEALYRIVLETASIQANERVLDIYCGIGSLTLLAARRALMATGIESQPAAVHDARQNAAANGVRNARFECGPAEVLLARMADRGERVDVALLDPPRAGCGRAALDALIRLAPSRLLYVSCNPATLARDLRILADGGYALDTVQPVDMFPQTAHVECVAGTHYVGSGHEAGR